MFPFFKERLFFTLLSSLINSCHTFPLFIHSTPVSSSPASQSRATINWARGNMATASSSSTPPTPRPPSVERTKGPTGLEKLVLRESRGWSAEVTNSIASHPLLFGDDLGRIHLGEERRVRSAYSVWISFMMGSSVQGSPTKFTSRVNRRRAGVWRL